MRSRPRAEEGNIWEDGTAFELSDEEECQHSSSSCSTCDEAGATRRHAIPEVVLSDSEAEYVPGDMISEEELNVLRQTNSSFSPRSLQSREIKEVGCNDTALERLLSSTRSTTPRSDTCRGGICIGSNEGRSVACSPPRSPSFTDHNDHDDNGAAVPAVSSKTAADSRDDSVAQPAHNEPSLNPEEILRRRRQVAEFLVNNGFAGVMSRRKSFLGSTFPLQVAAKLADDTLVQLLLEEAADTNQRDSSGRTATDVAKRNDRHGSHTKVLRILEKSNF